MIDTATSAISAHLGKTVEIVKGFDYPTFKPTAAKESVSIKVPSDTNDVLQNIALSEQLSNMIRAIPEMREFASTETPDQTKDRVKGELEQLAKDGVGLPENISKWRGVDTKIGGGQVSGHLLDINHSPETGTTIVMRIAKAEGQDNGKELAALVKSLQDDLETSKQTIGGRSTDAKKGYGLSEEDKAKLAALKYEITSNEAEKHSEIFITIRSPEQVEVKNATQTVAPEKLEAARASNPLNKLAPEKLGKLLGHSLLIKDKKLKPEFTPYLGTKDMQALLRRAAKHYAESPNASEEVKKRLTDIQKEELLVDPQQWSKPLAERHEWKTPVRVGVDPNHPGFVTATIPVKAGDGDKVLALLATLPPKQEQSQQQQPVEAEKIAEQILAQSADKALAAQAPEGGFAANLPQPASSHQERERLQKAVNTVAASFGMGA